MAGVGQRSMNTDGKSFENLDILIQDIVACKNSLEMLLIKIGSSEMALGAEGQTDWPTILNSLRIVSTDLISICKFVKDKKEMMLKSCVLMPKAFSEDVDPELKEMTNNRISVFNQDAMPIILRTKLIPQLEENEMKAYMSAKEFESIKAYDKNINQFKKAIEESANLVERPRRDFDISKQATNPTTFNMNDTWQLLNIIVNGSQDVLRKSVKYF